MNLSLETSSFLGLFGGGGGAELAMAVEYAWTRGAVPVIAAGNASLFSSSANYGAANALVVGATGRSNELASYSVPTGSAKWAILAPGGNAARGGTESEIYSTFVGNRYAYIQGTSMAVPHVSGAVALLLARGLSPQRAVEVLLSTADRSVACGANSPTCVGRLDVGRAVAATGAPPPAPPAPPPTTPPTTAAPVTASLPQPATTVAPPRTGPAPTNPAPTTTRPPTTTSAPSTAIPPGTTSPPTAPVAPTSPPTPTTPSIGPGAVASPESSVPPAVSMEPPGTFGFRTLDSGAPGGEPQARDEDAVSREVALGEAEPTSSGTPAGFRPTAAVAAALLALALAALVLHPPPRRPG